MGRISRRQAIQGAAATAVATTLGTPSVHAQKDQQTLRFVPHVDLKIALSVSVISTTGIAPKATFARRDLAMLNNERRDADRPPKKSSYRLPISRRMPSKRRRA